jgi:hypothetical protein
MPISVSPDWHFFNKAFFYYISDVISESVAQPLSGERARIVRMIIFTS